MGIRQWWESWSDPELPSVKKRRREKEAIELVQKLYGMGVQDPQTINAAANEFIRTGNIKIPTTQEIRTRVPSPDPKDTFPMTEVDVRPVKLGNRVGKFDVDTGAFSEVPEAQGVDEIMKMASSGTGTGGRGRGGKSPRQIADEITVRGYESMKRQKDLMGDPAPIQEEYTLEYEAARKRLGLPPAAKAPAKPASAPPPPPEPGILERAGKVLKGAAGRVVTKMAGGAAAPAANGTANGSEASNGDEKTKAAEWLKANGAPVTEANIQAVLKKGVLRGR